MRIAAKAVAALTTLLTPFAMLASAQHASASSTQYYSLVAYGACGRIAPVRELTEATGGYVTAKSGLFTWNFTITNSTSRVHWQACGAGAPYGNYDVRAQRLSQTFAFTVTSPQVTSCTVPLGSCSGGIGSKTITATQAAYNVSSMTYYLNGQSISAVYPARVTVRASASVITGAYGGSVTTAAKAWAF
ncbi:MAG: hypothetical protein QOK10_3129 [Pseudonocardiales bacterium]|jgi:hypothetical protein|nr:hypothetical protein [Pseudonocardiales bacterium]